MLEQASQEFEARGLVVKADVDKKVFDCNDILKQDAYFEKTVMSQIKQEMNALGIKGTREDRVFIQTRISSQHLSQYNDIS